MQKDGITRLKRAYEDYLRRKKSAEYNHLMEMGTQASSDGDFERSIRYYEEALSFEPDSVETLQARADSFRQGGQPRDAAEDYTRLIGQGFYHAYYFRALCYKKLLNWESVNADTQEAVKHSESVQAYELLTEAYKAMAAISDQKRREIVTRGMSFCTAEQGPQREPFD